MSSAQQAVSATGRENIERMFLLLQAVRTKIPMITGVSRHARIAV